MPEFQCRFLNANDGVVYQADLEVESLEAAKIHAYGIMDVEDSNSGLEVSPHFEIWQQGVLLFRSSGDNAREQQSWE